MKKVLLLMLIFLLSPALADIGSFQGDLNYANQHRGDIQYRAKQFKPEQNFQHFTSNPKQTKYYNGVTQGGDNNLSADATSNVNKDTAGSTVNNAFNTRPVFHVNHKSHAMLMGALIESDASNISRGISDKYVNCKRKQDCHVVYKEETCNEAIGPSSVNCTKTLDVSVKRQKYEPCTHILVSAEEPAYALSKLGPWVNEAGNPNWIWLVKGPDGNGNCAVGYVYVHGSVAKKSSAALTVPKNFPANVIVASSGTDCRWRNPQGQTILTTSTGQKLQTNGTKSVVLNGDKNVDRNVGMTVENQGYAPIFSRCDITSYGAVTVPYELKPVTQDTWADHCQFLEQRANLGICAKEKEACSSGKATHYIDGTNVTRDCWAKSATYNCQIASSDNNCQYLRDKACTQVDSSCRTKIGDICVVNNETYSCPNKKCSDASGIVCGGDFFCTKGDCSKHDAVKNGDFNTAVAGMAAVGAAGEDVKKSNGVHAFTGQAMDCSEDMIGFKNCCADKGWGKDTGLAHCTDEEKKLGKEKQKKVVIYVGRYCHNHVLGFCTSHHRGYCAFDSKLARIVQQQGRSKQLHISFGSADSPNCRGLTPDELGKVDFGIIDFSEIYNDIKNNTKFPDVGSTKNNIMTRVKELYDHSKKHS